MTAVLHGDCLAILPTLPPDSFDSCVTDPPYHLVSVYKRFANEARNEATVGNGAYGRHAKGFMGKQWDGGDVAARPETWAAVYRTLKPGAHLVAFGGTRTYHRMACAIEDAGFEIRDCIQWIYGSGFPKSHDVSKGIDRTLGAEGGYGDYKTAEHNRTWKRESRHEGWARPWMDDAEANEKYARQYVGGTDEARQWQGWGTALKPACEPIVLARKPLSESTVAANVLRWGTGAINVDGCRVEFAGIDDAAAAAAAAVGFAESRRRGTATQSNSIGKESRDGTNRYDPFALRGRWPANVVHDGSDEVVQGFPAEAGGQSGGLFRNNRNALNCADDGSLPEHMPDSYGDCGSAARFFYTAKADGDERIGSKHPTVKPIDLMQWLVRLVTPKGGAVLDPFAGTGTTGEAAWREGCRATLIEREAEYLADIARRMELMKAGPDERQREIIKASGKAQGHEDLPLFDRQWADMWAKPFDRPELVWGKK